MSCALWSVVYFPPRTAKKMALADIAAGSFRRTAGSKIREEFKQASGQYSDEDVCKFFTVWASGKFRVSSPNFNGPCRTIEGNYHKFLAAILVVNFSQTVNTNDTRIIRQLMCI